VLNQLISNVLSAYVTDRVLWYCSIKRQLNQSRVDTSHQIHNMTIIIVLKGTYYFPNTVWRKKI